MITLNSDHPAFEKIFAALEDVDPKASVDDLRERVGRANDAVKLLFEAWARLEDEASSAQARGKIRDTRQDWGRMARDFLDFGMED